MLNPAFLRSVFGYEKVSKSFPNLANGFLPFLALKLLELKVIFGMISCLGRLWSFPRAAGQSLTSEYVLPIITPRLDIKYLEHFRRYRIVLMEPGVCGHNGVHSGL